MTGMTYPSFFGSNRIGAIGPHTLQYVVCISDGQVPNG